MTYIKPTTYTPSTTQVNRNANRSVYEKMGNTSNLSSLKASQIFSSSSNENKTQLYEKLKTVGAEYSRRPDPLRNSVKVERTNPYTYHSQYQSRVAQHPMKYSHVPTSGQNVGTSINNTTQLAQSITLNDDTLYSKTLKGDESKTTGGNNSHKFMLKSNHLDGFSEG